MNQANRAFDDAEARNAGNPAYQAYPAGAHRHLGLIAEAVLAERAAMREAVASAMAAPGTDPESAEATRIIERLRAGEPPVRSPARREPPPSPARSRGQVSRRAVAQHPANPRNHLVTAKRVEETVRPPADTAGAGRASGVSGGGEHSRPAP